MWIINVGSGWLVWGHDWLRSILNDWPVMLLSGTLPEREMKQLEQVTVLRGEFWFKNGLARSRADLEHQNPFCLGIQMMSS